MNSPYSDKPLCKLHLFLEHWTLAEYHSSPTNGIQNLVPQKSITLISRTVSW